MSIYKYLISSFKSKFFIFCFCCVSFQTIQAGKVIINGYYINQKGDTVRVRFLVPVRNVKLVDTTQNFDDVYTSYTKVKRHNQKKIQESIIIINNVGKKTELIPSHCKYFQVNLPDDTLRYLSIKTGNIINPYLFSYKDSIFIRLLLKGPLSLYQYVNTTIRSNIFVPNIDQSPFGSPAIINPLFKKYLKYCLMKEDDPEPFIYSKLFFRDDITHYLKDCADVVHRIKIGQYRASDIVKIVNEYNKCKLNYYDPWNY